MSITAVVLDGARRAATYAAMLFSLNAPPTAVAQPAAALAHDGWVTDAGLTLTAHHLDVRVVGERASVQALMLLRNDRAAEVALRYPLAAPARVVRSDAADLPPEVAEQAETASVPPLRQNEVIVVAPGEQIGIELRREVPLATTGGVHRLQLPLPVDREAPWVPRFTADVLVEAGQPIRRLSSPTHQALVDGLGENSALLSVPDGFVYRQTELAIEYELGRADTGRPVASLDGVPARRSR
jgi:hypothetical protein